jgi:hypothetical protein
MPPLRPGERLRAKATAMCEKAGSTTDSEIRWQFEMMARLYDELARQADLLAVDC